jgi:signal transduction histidine kinase
VESSELSLLLSQISAWPKSQAEMDDLAGKIANNLNAECIVILPPKQSEAIGIGFSKPKFFENLNRQGFLDYFKGHLKGLELKENELKRISVQRKELYWPSEMIVHGLSLFPLKETGVRTQSEVGVLVVGTEKDMKPQEETAWVAVSRHFCDLLRISELETAVQIRNQFLSIASHELKTPLTSIYGILQLQERMLRLKKNGPSFPDQERHHNFLKMVIRQVGRLNELIDGLLDVSRIQNGRFMVEPSDTDVAILLRDMTQARLNMIAQEAGVKLTVDSLPRLIVRVDPVRMEEVISNLVMNAIRFSPEGGVIWIRLREEDGAFRLTVRDQGPSIPLEDRERIFQPFERAQRTSRMGGLGLGLFIARQIAQLHGGNVSLVESVPGKGNVFEAYFPIRPGQLASA